MLGVRRVLGVIVGVEGLGVWVALRLLGHRTRDDPGQWFDWNCAKFGSVYLRPVRLVGSVHKCMQMDLERLQVASDL